MTKRRMHRWAPLVVPGLLLLAGGFASGSEAERRNNHFFTIKELVDNGMRLPAERAINAFGQAGYPDAQWYEKGLRYHYADYFRTAAPGPIAGPLEEQYAALRQELEGARDHLPTKVRQLVEGAGDADLRRYTTLILRDLNPDAPPPLVPFTEERQREFEGRLRRLLRSADETLQRNFQAIQDFEPRVEASWDLDPEGREYQEVFQGAILLRYEYAHSMYTVYKALREVIQRGSDFGLPASLRREIVEPWLHRHLSERADDLGQWEWHYAEYYPLLRHRLAVLMSEIVRLNERREDLETIGRLSYDDVRRSFFGVIDLDISQFGRQHREGLTVLKYETWSDLLFWHLAMGTDRALTEAARMWDDYQSRNMDPLNSRDRTRQQLVGHLHLLAARIFHARDEANRRNALCVAVQQADNFFAVNARQWLTYFAQAGGDGGGSWAAMPSSEDPSVAMSLSSELRRTARNTVDDEVASRLRADAQVVLRNAILGLPNANDPEFLDVAPQLYQSFAFSLYDDGLLYEAVIAAEAGLNRFKPLWERSRNQGGNPWMRGGELTAAGEMVRRLAGDLLIYTQRLRGRDSNSATRDAYGRAISLLQAFDPERAAEGLEWNQFVIHMQQGEFEMAQDVLRSYEQSNPDQQLRVLGAWARLRYAQFNALNASGAGEDRMQRAQNELDETVDRVRNAIQGMVEGDEEIPEGQRGEVQNLWRFLTTVQVATMFQSERYREVLETLGPEFWERLQDDRDLNRQLFTYLSGSAYRVGVAIARDQERRQDPALMLELWPYYTNAVEVYERLVRRWPELVERTTSNRRQIAALFNITRQLTNWFQQNVDAGTEGFTDYEQDLFSGMSNDAQGFFARIFPVDEDTDMRTVLSVAMAHWNQGNRAEAVPLFERYKEQLSQDPKLMSFNENPERVLNEVGRAMSQRQALRPFWERRGEDSIPELLVDAPELHEMILDPNVRQADWPERKRDYAAALRQTDRFGELLQSQRSLIADFDSLWEQFQEFRSLVQNLAYSVQIDTMLVEAYREMGRGGEAVALARELWDYDPLNPVFMTLIIEGTLERINQADTPAEADVRDALNIAARLRNIVSGQRERRDLYWIASSQVMELLHYTGDRDSVNRILRRQAIDNNNPPADLSVPGSNPRRARNAQAIEIADRYLQLFDLEGITVERPYMIEERDGEVLFVRSE